MEYKAKFICVLEWHGFTREIIFADFKRQITIPFFIGQLGDKNFIFKEELNGKFYYESI